MNEQTSKEIVELKSIDAEKAFRATKQRFNTWDEAHDILDMLAETLWVGKIFMNKKEYCVYAPENWEDNGFLRESFAVIVLTDAVEQIYKSEGISGAEVDIRICAQSEDKRCTECQASVWWNRRRQFEERHFVFIQ